MNNNLKKPMSSILAYSIHPTKAAGMPKGLGNFMCLTMKFPITRAQPGSSAGSLQRIGNCQTCKVDMGKL